MNSLDQSHRTVLEQLATFRLAQRCFDETEAYVLGALQQIRDEFASLLHGTDTLSFKEGCLQLDAFPNWQGTEFHFVSVGLEKIKVGNLLGDEPCRAFIWSAYLHQREGKAPSPDVCWLRGATRPAGFEVSRRRGYVAERNLGALTVDQVMNRSEVHRHFREPLADLSRWLDDHRTEIGAMAQPSPATSA